MKLAVWISRCGYSYSFDQVLLNRNLGYVHVCRAPIVGPDGSEECGEQATAGMILKNLDKDGIWDCRPKPEEEAPSLFPGDPQ
jgi:hypothetical protein